MEMINLDQCTPCETQGHSSKGNQLKFKLDGYWYKADHMGYEGLAEVIVSRLLQHSNIKNFVVYEPAMIEYKGTIYKGCKSLDFLQAGEELVTVDHLYRQYTGLSLTSELSHINTVRERVAFFVQVIHNFTGLKDFGKYMSLILELDAFFLNEDRHTNNIALKYNSKMKKYLPCHIFDNGLALFADTSTDFIQGTTVAACTSRIQAKPFAFDFDEQADEAVGLYGRQLNFTFQIRDVKEELDKFHGIYEEWILERIEDTLRQQMRKYQYLFHQ